MSLDLSARPADAGAAPPDEPKIRDRATVALLAVEAGAFVFWLIVSRKQWFFHDEWDFLAGRKAGDIGDLFRPHGQHWVTIPVLIYRALYSVFGLRTYLPYRVPVLTLHLVAAALLTVVMRRAGVRPWIAFATTIPFVFLGAAQYDVIVPFQVAFTGALVFGLIHLLLADHDGPFDRRDAFGLLAGFVGLMFSGVAVTMVAIVGLAVLIRRGWRLAAIHTLPLAVCFLVWLVAIGREGFGKTRMTLSGLPRFVLNGLSAGLRDLVHYLPVEVAAVAMLGIGLGLLLLGRDGSGRRAQLIAPLALLCGSVVFLTITSTGRSAFGAETASNGRFAYLVVALALPALVLAADAVAARWQWCLPAVLLIFAIGLPHNLHVAINVDATRFDQSRDLILSLAHDPLARTVPRSVRPEPVASRPVTIGWLLDGVAQHRIPDLGKPVPPTLAADDRFRLAFYQHRGRAPTTGCVALARPRVLVLAKGDVLGLYDNAIVMRPARKRPLLAGPIPLLPVDGSRIEIIGAAGRVAVRTAFLPLNWRMSQYNTHLAARVCIHKGAR